MEETGLRWPWWAAASSAQLTAGIAWYRRGYCGSGASMPFKAFAIATLFVGAGSTAVRSALLAAGIRTPWDAFITMNLRKSISKIFFELLAIPGSC
ncbi:uncharacterized protein LOC121977616 isoform X1 [Zingiber officinale]|uniref:uncharacterized protein LOC121977616 isoform X1 n=1 Tax=Zingiber officinale TaxID=94328 RepID=UPI001C4AC052|nr:uncharacterized protein LOC121977616 isoform X1 [Zingiber officinale]